MYDNSTHLSAAALSLLLLLLRHLPVDVSAMLVCLLPEWQMLLECTQIGPATVALSRITGGKQNTHPAGGSITGLLVVAVNPQQQQLFQQHCCAMCLIGCLSQVQSDQINCQNYIGVVQAC